MAPTVTQALEVFSERNQIVPENLSILAYTEEEEVQDYFDVEWDEQDVVAATSPSRRASVEAICSSCVVTDSSSVLGVHITPSTPTTPTSDTSPRRLSSPLLLSIGETLSFSKVATVATLYRPSELGINLTSVIGDPRRATN